MKKFLSLVLALVMTMSLVTISAGATEYKDLTDKDDLGIQYQEAVAVLNKIGVITGYDDGSFRPDVELTRGAAAKIIVSMLLGPEAASNLPNNAAPYPDVPANHTFAGVISYCKNSKIINGYSDGTFKPSDTLTGFAFAKMLLGALGYDNAREGLSGAGWTMNVASLGQEATLFDRIDFKGGDPVTRKDAALLALNTLKATVVEYKGGSTITVGDAQAVVNSERTYKTSNQDYARNILPQRRNIQNDLNSRADYNTVEFAEEHFVDLRLPHDKYSPTRDEYGRPSAEWSYKKLSIGTFPLEPDFEYTTQVIHAGKSIDTTTDAAKVRALGLSGYYVDDKLDKDDGSSSSLDTYTNLWINGVLQDSTGGTDARLSKTAEIADYTDNGTLVQVYVDNNGADRITDVVVIKTQMMEVRRVGSDYVSLDLYKDHSDADGKILYGYNDEPIDVAVNNVETGDDYFEFLSGLKVGDLVAVEPVAVDHNVSNKRDYDVGHAYTPETVSGALTNVETYGNVDKDRNAVNLTVGGTKYPIALWNRDLHSIDPNTVRVTTKDITLHMDKYGNAMVAKNIGATKDWMVIGNYRQSIVNGILVTFANGWDIDGKAVSLNVGAHNTNVGGTQGVWNNGLPPVGSLVYYTNSLNSNTAEWDLHWQTGQTEVDQNGDGSSVPKWTQPYDGNKYGVFDVFIGDNDDTNPYDLGVNSQRIQLYNYGNTAGTPNDLAYRDSGIKFIYITMDESGEVDSIEVKSGMQRTSNAELKGTGSRFEPYNIARAQACVALKDGKVTADSGVKAVVIKSESNAVSLRNLLYITNTDGEIRREDGTVYQKYEVAMYNESGKLETDRHIEIWSDRLNLAIGSFARYTKMDNATFENFYSLRPYGADAYETVGRSVAVARTYLDHTGNAFVGANNNLIHLDGTKYAQNVARSAVGGYKIGDYQDRDHNIINGEQKEFAYNLVDFRGAEFIDMTGKNWDIENVDDLKEAYNKSFDFYKLDEKNEHRDINLTLLFNDNPDNDGFRQVYLVIVNSVSSSEHDNSGSSPIAPSTGDVTLAPSQNGKATVTGNVTSLASGVTRFNMTLTAPEWAVTSPGKVNVKYSVLVDGVLYDDNKTLISDGSTGNLKWDATAKNYTTNGAVSLAAAGSDAFTGKKVTIRIDEVNWTDVKVKVEGAILAAPYTGNTLSTVSAAAVPAFTLSDNEYTGKATWTITGAEPTVAGDPKTGDTSNAGVATSIGSFKANGDGYVVVTISNLTPNTSRTNIIKSNVKGTTYNLIDATPVPVEQLKSGLAAGLNLTLTVDPIGTATKGTGEITGFTAANTVQLKLTAGGRMPATVSKYTVTVSYTKNGVAGTVVADVTGTGDAILKDTSGAAKYIQMDADVTITGIDIVEVAKGTATMHKFENGQLVVDYFPARTDKAAASDLAKEGAPLGSGDIERIVEESIDSRAAGTRVTYIFASSFAGTSDNDEITLNNSNYVAPAPFLYWDATNNGWSETEVTTPEPPQAETINVTAATLDSAGQAVFNIATSVNKLNKGEAGTVKVTLTVKSDITLGSGANVTQPSLTFSAIGTVVPEAVITTAVDPAVLVVGTETTSSIPFTGATADTTLLKAGDTIEITWNFAESDTAADIDMGTIAYVAATASNN